MPPVEINYLAMIVAAIASMVVGALWYSPFLFGKQWMELTGKTEEDLKEGAGKAYALTFIGSLVTAFVFSHFIDYVKATTVMEGIQTAFWI